MLEVILERVSYHAVYDRSCLEAMQFAKANGFAGIQLADETPHLSFERLSEAEVGRIAEFSASQGVSLSIHAPDTAASLFLGSPLLSAGILGYFRGLLEFARRVGAKLVTLHAGSMTTFGADDGTERQIPAEDLHLYSSAFRGNLDSLLRLAEGRVPICVENVDLAPNTLELLVPYLERGDLHLCWDLPKGAADPEMDAFFFSHPEWVRQVHLHDRRVDPGGKARSHRVIGTGEIDFPRYLRTLAKADVWDYCIEVRPREKALESLERLKRLIAGMDAAGPTPGDDSRPGR